MEDEKSIVRYYKVEKMKDRWSEHTGIVVYVNSVKLFLQITIYFLMEVACLIKMYCVLALAQGWFRFLYINFSIQTHFRPVILDILKEFYPSRLFRFVYNAICWFHWVHMHQQDVLHARIGFNVIFSFIKAIRSLLNFKRLA